MDNIGRLLYLDYVTDKVNSRGYNMIMCRAIVSLRSRKVRLLFRHHKHIGKWDAKPQAEIDFSELKKVYNEIAGVDCNQFEKIVYCVTKILQDRYIGRWFNGNIRVSNGARVLTTIESGNLKQLFDFEPGEEDTEKNIDAPYHITEQDLKYMVKAAVSRLLNEEYVGLDYNACKAEAEKYTRK